MGVDGHFTTPVQESAFWKSVMVSLYGEDWAMQLAAAEDAPEGATSEQSFATAQASGPSLAPAAAAGAPREQAAVVTAKLDDSPGSGNGPGAAASEPRTPARVKSPGSGAATPGSWDSQAPGSPSTLTGRVLRGFHPDLESYDHYANRVKKQAAALVALEAALPAGALDELLVTASYQQRMHVEARDDRPKQISLLRREYVMERIDPDGSMDQQVRIAALESLLRDRGFDIESLKHSVGSMGQGNAGPTVPVGGAGTPALPPSGVPSLVPAADAGAPSQPAALRIFTGGGGTPVDGTQLQEMEKMKERIRLMELEQAAQRAVSASGAQSPFNLADVVDKQNILLERVLTQKKPPGSTIRVEPKVFWPKLGDDGPGGKEVEEFYDKFEDICGLANNGTGMSDKEMLIALKTCLTGSRRTIYDNVYKAKKGSLDTDDGPGDIYRTIKKRLFRFLETATEKQLRVKGEWNNLTKTRGMTALQFEAEWEQIHAELEEVGLSLNPLDKFLAYIMKVGPPISETIRMDRRPRPDKSGGTTTRTPETWEECHEVLCEIEGVKAGSRAFSAARAAGLRQHQPETSAAGDGSKGGGKHDKKGDKGGKKGRDGGDPREGKGPRDPEKKPPCFEFRDTGKCKYGDNCRFSHSPKDTGRTPTGALTKAARKAAAKAGAGGSPSGQAEADASAAGKGRGRGKGKGKEGKDRKTIICKYIKDPKKGTCPDGKNCTFSHSKRLFDANWKYVWK